MIPALLPLVTGAEVTFWICAPLMVLGALGLVFARKPAYSALSMAFVMIALAALYAAMDAPFLAMIQVIVYTGAILMMFLFVLMMVGVDSSDSLVETIRGQRPLAILGGIGVAALLIFGIAGTITQPSVGLETANAQYGGNVASLAALLFGRYVFVFELTAALLIVAAVGAMMLAHHTRVTKKKGQADIALDRMRDYAAKGEHPGSLPNSGVFASTNAIGAPALLPDGTPSEKSLSQTLVLRGATIDPTVPTAETHEAFRAIAAVTKQEDDE